MTEGQEFEVNVRFTVSSGSEAFAVAKVIGLLQRTALKEAPGYIKRVQVRRNLSIDHQAEPEQVMRSRVVHIPSSSEYGKDYEVTFSNDVPVSCSCPHYVNRLQGTSDWCKHMFRAREV